MPETQASRHILERIVETKRSEVEGLRSLQASLEAKAEKASPPRDLQAVLAEPDTVALIAEVKRRSPGAGVIRESLDPVDQARRYHAGGAAAVSVLTDRTYFGGSVEDLAAVREAVPLPVLRKDFVIDPVQLFEARAAGADAFLLIVRILEDHALSSLRALGEDLGMTAVVEVHDGAELDRALRSGVRVLGINNRDLRTFRTDLEVTLNLMSRVPPDVLVVSESGIGGPEDVDHVGAAGADAVLVGEWLVRQPDAREAAKRLSGRRRSSR